MIDSATVRRARWRERFATDPIAPAASADTAHAKPRTTEDTAGVETAVPEENLEATAT